MSLSFPPRCVRQMCGSDASVERTLMARPLLFEGRQVANGIGQDTASLSMMARAAPADAAAKERVDEKSAADCRSRTLEGGLDYPGRAKEAHAPQAKSGRCREGSCSNYC
jgi:hypothetical protein